MTPHENAKQNFKGVGLSDLDIFYTVRCCLQCSQLLSIKNDLRLLEATVELDMVGWNPGSMQSHFLV